MAPVFVAVKVGTVPDIGLLLRSKSVTVIVDEETPSALTAPVPVIVVVLAEALPAVKLTVPDENATGVKRLSVLVSALVDLRVHVETPEAFVLEQMV